MTTDLPRLLSGRYEVGELLGRGGMAEVHLGHDTRLGRQVAIKMLRTDLARDASFLSRFRREAQASAGLNHASIVAVYDSGEDHVTESGGAVVSVPFIVMEYVEGQTLRQVLRARGPFAPDEATRITEGVLDALAYSHRKGIVHRDIKPANVMIGPGGAVKVMDFGIARAIADANATMTQTQAVIGTAQYLSPEQAQGQSVDARSDLYSTGCMLFELLTGRPPFQGDSPVAIAYQHVGETPAAPSTLNPEVSSDLDAVVLHALVKDREGRYQSAASFRSDLQAARSGRSLSAAALGTATQALPAGQPTERLGTGAAVRAAGVGAAAGAGAAAAAADDGDSLAPYSDGQHDPASDQPYGRSGGTSEIPVVGSRAQQREQERRRGGTAVILGIAVIAALALLGFGLKTYLDGQEAAAAMRRVPTVLNLSQAAAEKAIKDRELVPVVQQEASDSVKEGMVISQLPEAGEQLRKGSNVTISVSTGPSSVQVPALGGRTVEEAEALLKAQGLTLGSQEKINDSEVDVGKIISSQPAEGSDVKPGSAVKVRVSTGKVTVPSVVGMDENKAIEALSKAGLVAQRKELETNDAKANTVARQNPRDGLVDRGSNVEIFIAKPKPTPTPTPSTSTSPPPSSSPPTSSSPGPQGPNGDGPPGQNN